MVSGLAGCGALTPMPPLMAGGSTPATRDRLASTARAHGAEAFRRFYDINLRLTALPMAVPTVDQEGVVELRALTRRGLIAGHRPASAGASGARSTAGLDWHRRLPGDFGLPNGPAMAAWQSAAAITDGGRLDALAAATDLAWVALLGPLAFIDIGLDMESGPPLWVQGRRLDGLRLRRATVAGDPPAADYLLHIDPLSGLVVRIACLPPSGDIVWLDLDDPVDRHGVRWPSRFSLRAQGLGRWSGVGFGRLGDPLMRWQLTGLDVDRLYGLAALPAAGAPRDQAAAAAKAITG